MPRALQPYPGWSSGQITLEQAWCCVDCKLIFAGTTRCSCCGYEAVWPVTQWLPCSLPLLPARACPSPHSCRGGPSSCAAPTLRRPGPTS
jgi:hypothetical protein